MALSQSKDSIKKNIPQMFQGESGTCRFSVKKMSSAIRDPAIYKYSISKLLGVLEVLGNRKPAAFTILYKAIKNACADAKNKGYGDPDTLKIHKINLQQKSTFKRIEFRARGRADRLRLRRMNTQVVLIRNLPSLK